MDAWFDPAEEDRDFENGFEDMELRARRLEAEREAQMDAECSAWGAYQDYLDAMAERGVPEGEVKSFEDFCRPVPFVPAPPPADEVEEDDIPF